MWSNKQERPEKDDEEGQLRQAVVGGSLPPAQQFREWQSEALALAMKCDRHNLHLGTSVAQAMAKAYERCADLLERQ